MKIKLLLFLLLPISLCAQIDIMETIDSLGIETIDFLNDEIDQESGISEVLEEWLDAGTQKIDLNTATPSVLSGILKLTDRQIYELRAYIELYGYLVNVCELSAIQGFSTEDIERILPQITVLPAKESLKNFLKKGFTKGSLKIILKTQTELEKRAGYINGNYPGSPFYGLLKVQYNYRQKVRYGFTAEKDAGESFFKGAQKTGFDFYSFHFSLSDLGVLKTLCVGDYRISFGQGLTIGMPVFSNGTADVRYLSPDLKPYTSTAESGFQRGVAAKLGFWKFKTKCFYSYAPWNDSGLHRTKTEIAKKNAFLLHSAGGSLEFTHQGLNFGVHFINHHLSKSYSINPQFYQRFYFQGQNSFNLGVSYQYMRKHWVFYGETAFNETWAAATLNGVVFKGIPRVDLAYINTYFSPQYHALSASGVLNNSRIANEAGNYFSAVFQLPKSHTLTLYVMGIYHPEAIYGIDAPSRNYRLRLHYRLPVFRVHSFEGRYVLNFTPVQQKTDEITAKMYQKFKHVFDFRFKTDANARFRSQSILCASISEGLLKRQSFGVLAAEYLSFKCHKPDLTVYLICAVFNTDSYDDRFYVYEPDLLYAFSMPMFYGRGSRVALMLQYRWKYISFWIKAGQFFYPDQSVIGSGNDQIQSFTKTEIKAQIIFHLLK